MINKQANILFIPSSISGIVTERQAAPSQHSYYQELIYASLARGIHTREGVQFLGKQLAAIARQAYLARQTDIVETVSRVMLALPLPDSLHSVARYYQLILLRERSPRPALENLLDDTSLPLAYRARVLQTLGGTYIAERDPSTATILAFESLRIATAPDVNDLLSTVEGVRQVAISQSINGDHEQALAELEKFFPAARAIGKYYPAAYYDFVNSLAVEFSEVGRVSEAEAACAIALASPFASAYPEWSETCDEIAAKRKSASPSVVAIHRVLEADRTLGAHRALEVDRAAQAELQRQPRPFSAFASSSWARNSVFFQRSIIPIPTRTAILLDAVSTLDRVLACIGPRAPPFPQCHHTDI